MLVIVLILLEEINLVYLVNIFLVYWGFCGFYIWWCFFNFLLEIFNCSKCLWVLIVIIFFFLIRAIVLFIAVFGVIWLIIIL